jgi:hypothetical protein
MDEDWCFSRMFAVVLVPSEFESCSARRGRPQAAAKGRVASSSSPRSTPRPSQLMHARHRTPLAHFWKPGTPSLRSVRLLSR